jgi:beta-N-acetylhexosaminidase
MTPEQRIGQLFLITFQGSQAGPDTQIYELISNYYIGGVLLLAANDNFTNDGQTIQNAINLTRQLQTARWEASRESRTDPVTGESFIPTFVPLFISTSQEGDGYPYNQILKGLPPLPNQMALGATWNSDLARQVGDALGQQMSAIGVNFLLGPSLDVLENPHTDTASDLGTRTFGGDPYWVGKLGQAFIEGVHTGSAGQLAVIAKHFPGHGGSDRLPEDEVATVRRSLDQLLSFELSPFIEVTGNAPTQATTTDGLLTSHIRFQGFQGNIRATTRPVSFDPQALDLLLKLPPIDSWRQNGGIMVSDNLGGRAVRGFYDLTTQEFDMVRRVALNAFLAGNDLLYIADFSSGDLDSFTAAQQTLQFFTQKYREDPAFAQRVDESVLRILALKLRLYQDFNLDGVLVPETVAEGITQAVPVSFDVARRAATLISPSQVELDETLPNAPDLNDRVVFITDTREAKQCSECAAEPILAKRALEQSVLRLYGPQAGDQVTPANLISYSTEELQIMLDSERNTTSLERNLRRADWVIFSMLDASNRYPSYQTLSRFLSERPDLFQNKNLIVFAFNAPYFLDATNISKLTAYFGLYSKIPESVDTAAYLLFQELRAEGASPVSIPGVSYDLSVALFPSPEQVISLAVDMPADDITQPIQTLQPTPMPAFETGDSIAIRTGVIMDQNGHQVPDNTPVEFLFSYNGDLNASRQIEFTIDGVARTNYTINNFGSLKIQAISEPAQPGILTFEIPAPENIETPPPTPTTTPTETPVPTDTPTPVVTPTPETPPPSLPGLGDWLMATLISVSLAWTAYKLISLSGSSRWAVRFGFVAAIGGLTAYIYLLFKLPGTEKILENSVSQGVFIATFAGVVIGLLVAWSWQVIATNTQRKGSSPK